MLINRNAPAEGICFAWLPKRTPDGVVWLEHVHFKYNDSEFGSWSYTRFVPQEQYDNGSRTSPITLAYPNARRDKAFWDAWFALPIERRREIQRDMARDPL